ncbi:hypothetical protein VSDG_09902 [Cytospora chrysosperma]|uniref:Uncharacterized protein n=1 Tax=Cytospora chrysosperma TaxID=252740 RepID=A0A423V8W0_CYTCH|nr:hypothetical protein VSDG_09902 [Valsa sordida]
MDADDDAPEVAGQQADVEEGGRGHAQDEGREGVEDEEAQGVADDVADDGPVPGGLLEGVAVEDAGGCAADAHAQEAHKAQDLEDGPAGDIPLLKDVAQAVARRAGQAEQVALEHVVGGVGAGAGHGVAAQQHAHAAAGDQDAEDLEGLVADLEQQEGDDDDAEDGPEVEQLGAEEVGPPVGQDGEVVALDVQEGQDEVLPAVPEADARDLAPAVAVEHVRHVDEGEQDVVEEGLEGGDVGAVLDQERGEGAGGRVAEAEQLAQEDDDPEVPGGEVRVPVDLLGLEGLKALGDGIVLVLNNSSSGGGGACLATCAVDAGLYGVDQVRVLDVVVPRNLLKRHALEPRRDAPERIALLDRHLDAVAAGLLMGVTAKGTGCTSSHGAHEAPVAVAARRLLVVVAVVVLLALAGPVSLALVAVKVGPVAVPPLWRLIFTPLRRGVVVLLMRTLMRAE